MKKSQPIGVFTIHLTILLSFVSSFSLFAQNLDAYQKKSFIQEADTLPYRILLPKDYNPNTAYPLVLFLHGMGERGNDNQKQLIFGAKLFLNDSIRTKYPAVVVFPQCPEKYFWASVEIRTRMQDNNKTIIFPDTVMFNPAQKLLKGLIAKLKKDYSLAEKRFYVGGLSMGGMGTFETVNQNPKMFAAAFPICGGANPAIANRIKQPSWWLFHGEIDDLVSVQFSKTMYDALKAANADVKLTLYPNVKHNSWENAFKEPNLLPWLFSKTL